MNFLLLAGKPTTLGYVIIAVCTLAAAAFITVYQLKKHKLEKYKAENVQAGKDAALMFHYKDPTCPICNSLYSKSEASHMQQVEHPSLVGGTYFAGSTSMVTDTYYSCSRCGYRYTYAGRYVRSTEYYQDVEHKMERSLVFEGLGNLSEENRARLNKAVVYRETVAKMEEEVKKFWI